MNSVKSEKEAKSERGSASGTTAVSGSTSSAGTTGGAATSQEDVKSRGWPKGKKRYPKMPGAPKQPLSGYVHFLNDRREDVRKECPDISFADISKKLAVEWANIDKETKQRYVERAEVDKERYNKEFAEYKLTDNYKDYIKEQERKQQECKDGEPPKKKVKKAPASSAASSSEAKTILVKEEDASEASSDFQQFGGTDVPLFTKEFLEFNKCQEAELRQLRKQVAEMEEQNAVLQKHVENMQSAIAKLEGETAQQKDNSAALKVHLERIRAAVVAGFAGVKLPGRDAPVTEANADQFMQSLHGMVVQGCGVGNAEMLAKVKEVVGKINYKELV